MKLANVTANLLILKADSIGELEKIEEYFTFKKEGYQYSPLFRQGLWNGNVKFYFKKDTGWVTIPTGLYFRLCQVIPSLEVNSHAFGSKADSFYNILPPIPQKVRFDCKLNLRDYQVEAVESMFKHRRGIIKLPTGSGKTIVALEFLRRTNLPTIYLVNRKDLFYQTVKKMIDFGFSKVGLLGMGYFEPTYDIDVAMFQTVSKIDFNDEFWNHYSIVIVDECHHINFDAKIFKETVKALKKAPYRFGFSATPFRYNCKYADDITLIALIGEVIYEKKEIENFTSPVIIYPIRINYLGKHFLSFQNYRDTLNFIISLEPRHEIIRSLVSKHPKDKVLIIAPSLNHAVKLADKLGLPVVHGELSNQERRLLYERFKASEIKHLVSTTVYDEGVDFPDLNVLIFTEPFKSYLKVIQRVGRGRRISEGKTHLIVYDLVDELFLKQYNARKRVYQREGFLIENEEEFSISREEVIRGARACFGSK